MSQTDMPPCSVSSSHMTSHCWDIWRVIVDADVTATHATNAVLSYERNTDNLYVIQYSNHGKGLQNTNTWQWTSIVLHNNGLLKKREDISLLTTWPINPILLCRTKHSPNSLTLKYTWMPNDHRYFWIYRTPW